jgi:hypothetical protein
MYCQFCSAASVPMPFSTVLVLEGQDVLYFSKESFPQLKDKKE